jgi:lysophospholipase L1-like esterase
MLGANDVWHPEEFEPQMRKIIEFSIEKGVIPVLATKADDQEGNGSINATIARLALEYKIPLWNYWKAVQALPDKGLQEDGVHLTWGANNFDDPFAMENAWPVRNLTALQVLQALLDKISRQG